MNNDIEFAKLFGQVFLAALACVGIMEWIKNFWKTEKTWAYSLVMLPLAVGCYLACNLLPVWAIGSILTVGIVQNCYQIVIQAAKSIIKGVTEKAGGNVGEMHTDSNIEIDKKKDI